MLYDHRPTLVLGFHGCTMEVKHNVLCKGEHLTPSKNSYDWLGHGIYFWESDPTRAMQFARESIRRKKLKQEPAVVGAVIDLGHCMDLITQSAHENLRQAYEMLKDLHLALGRALPLNHGLLHDLDCQVINTFHDTIADIHTMQPYDSVRGLYQEGQPIYEGSMFRDKTHIQICVRNMNCIKGYFDPLDEVDEPFAQLKR